MPAATLPLPPSEALPRKRFTRAEVQQMIAMGLFAGQRFELIRGDLIDKMGQNPPHASAIRLLLELLAGVFGLKRVQVQLPIEAGAQDRETSMPEPDLAVLAASSTDLYRTRHPRGDELLLVIEVSDTTLTHDATTKRDLYARAGVAQYWVLDLTGRRLIVHRHPTEGKYRDAAVLESDEHVAIESVSLAVSAMLP